MGHHEKDKGYAWLIVLASFFIQFIGLGINSTFGLFYIEISREYPQMGKSGTSWIPSIMTALAHAVGPLVSILVNKYGIRAVSILGSLFTTIGFATSYYAKSAEILDISIGIAGGIGLGLLYLPAMVVIPRYFDKKLALATAIVVCGSGFGTLFFEWCFGLILANFPWREALLITALFFFCTIPFGILYRPFETDDPADPQSKRLLSCRPLPSSAKGQRAIVGIDLCLFKNIVFILFTTADLLTSFAYNIPQVYLPEIEHTLTRSSTNTLLGFIAGPMIASRLLVGWLSDKQWVNRHFIYTLALAVMGTVTAVSPHLNSIWYLRGYCVIFGIGIGIYLGLKSVILVDLLGVEKFTDSFGLLLLVQAIGMLFGAPVAGHFYDAFGDYSGGFYFAGGMFVLSAMVLTFIPTARKKMERDKEKNPGNLTCVFKSNRACYATFPKS